MKLSKAAIALCASLLVAGHGVASAAPIVDQNNPTVVGGFCSITGSFICGQSFYQTAGNISGAGIYLHPLWSGSSASVTIGLFDTISGGSLLAQGTASGVDSNSGWVDVFWNPVALNPATQYYLRLQSTNSNLVAAYALNGSYANGTAVYGNVYPGYDLTFRTYADDGASDVPEPASLALLGMGLLGVAASRRKRIKS